jgi:peptide/nickel transport system permease protein
VLHGGGERLTAAAVAWRGRSVARSPGSVLAWLVFLAFLLMALFGPWLVSADPLRQTSSSMLPIGSAGHLAGTDDLGRDQLARLVHGARPLIFVSLAATVLACGLGLVLGLAAGFYRGWVEQVTMRSVDVLLAFPSMLLVILIVAAIGTGAPPLVLGIGVAMSPVFARVVRATASREMNRDYVLAARASGARSRRIMTAEILPNMAGPLLVQAFAILSISAGFAAALSYIGLGIQPPRADWGYMVKAGQEFVFTEPALVVVPGLLTMLFVIACNFVGDDLRDAFDPRRRR